MRVKEENIVISGIGGRYPECKNLEEFKGALLEGIDLVTVDNRRYLPGAMKTPKRMGKIPDVDKFDAAFFRVHPRQANLMDPRQRILNETIYECIVDAGYNTHELRGSKTGVYVGIGAYEYTKKMREQPKTEGYTNTGVYTAMAANRAAYCFDFKGPSYALDTGCSSSSIALVNAFNDISSGLIDSAIVCGTNINNHFYETFGYNKLNMLAADGKCKVFSSLRDGYVRSEAVVSIFLQKEGVCRRIYATVLGANAKSDGYTLGGIGYPSTAVQLRLMEEVYGQSEIDPNEIAYVEAHGTGTPLGDTDECQAIVEIFCKKRKNALPIGAVDTNMGNAERASGFCSISKVLLAMESGIIPANLHSDPLDTELPGIKDGKLKVVNENLPWQGGIAALNSFGMTGANVHLILKSNPREKPTTYRTFKHRLVEVSGRTEESVHFFLDEIEKNQEDVEFLALIDEIHKLNVEGHNFRGYAILGSQKQREVERYTQRKPIWFIYPGMGSEWAGVGRDLLKFNTFRNTIKRCASALTPYGIDLEDILTNTSPSILNNITNCLTAIVAVEIALTDMLYSLDIIPDGFVGHSLGEVACAYADGQITPEEAILLAYARGYATERAKLPEGQMVAVGLSKEDCQELLPDGTFIACENGKDSVTITGLRKPIDEFVEELTSKGIFAKKLNSRGTAYHSIYVKDAGPILFDFIKKILKAPKPRSSRWVTSSVPESNIHESWAQYNCAEYHTNNFCNPVLFHQACKKIPNNAIVVEIAPYGLMQAVLKKELGQGVTNISLVKKNGYDNEHYCLSSIGKIFLSGGQPNLRKLYSEVSFPVSRGTKMIAPLVKWDHSVSWFVPDSNNKDFGAKIVVNLSDEKYSYLEGHNIDGGVLMPATGYLELVWKIFAGMNSKDFKNMPVVINNVTFNKATFLPPDEDVTFLINIMKDSGYFEIFEAGTVSVTGYVSSPENINAEFVNPDPVPNDKFSKMTKQDIYKECHLRQYKYHGYFQGLTECDVHGLQGKVEWKGKFTSFLDTMLHLILINENSRELMLATSVDQLIIDPIEHLRVAERYKVTSSNNVELPIFFNHYLNIVKSGGVEIIGMDFSKAPVRRQIHDDAILTSYHFVPYQSSKDALDFDSSLHTALYIILENSIGLTKSPKICIASDTDEKEIRKKIKEVLNNQILTATEYIEYSSNKTETNFNAIVLILTEKITEYDLEPITKSLCEGGFLLYIGNNSKFKRDNLQIVYQSISSDKSVHLLRFHRPIPKNYVTLKVNNNTSFNWLEQVQELMKNEQIEKVYLYSQFDDISGIIGVVKCLILEPSDVKFRSIFIQDKDAGVFSVDDEFYHKQLSKDLVCNVLQNGCWGTYVHMHLKKIENIFCEHATITILTPGDLSTLKWEQTSPNYFSLSLDAELVYVYYSALNFKDTMVSTGKMQIKERTFPETFIGFEYSGITGNGRRVMGMTYKTLSLQVLTDPVFTWGVPDLWSLEDAATIPCVYATCYYAMMIRGQLRPEESILIHAGSGGIGLAAISIALSMGCTVFTTVGSQEKRDFLKKIYPQLKDENIGSSRNRSFRNMIKLNTKGRGVDLVLNSLAVNLFQLSLKCIASRGRFLEIGKTDFLNESPINSKIFQKNCTFHGIFLDDLFDNSEIKKQINELLTKGIKSGVVKPLPRTTFNETEVEEAIRYLSTSKHKGKVLVQIRKEEGSTVKSPARTISAIPKLFFDPNKSYVLIEGQGGFGLELTDWMIKRGAIKLVLNSKRNNLNGYQTYCMKKWTQIRHTTVLTNFEDTSTLGGAKRLIEEAQKLGPLGGVFNMTIVLKDTLIINQTKEMYEDVFKAKIISGQNMDVITRRHCPALDHFVVFSSVTCGRGKSDQTSYGMANSALERLCEQRRKENLPGLAIQWGPIDDVGTLARAGIQDKVFDKMVPQSINSCLSTLETFMLQSADGSGIGASVVLNNKSDKLTTGSSKTSLGAVAHILGVKKLDLLDKSITLSQLGLDSLMVAEIKQTLYRNYQTELETDDIQNLTFSKLEEMTHTNGKASSTTTNVKNGPTTENNVLIPIITKDIIVELHKGEKNQIVFLIHPVEGQIEVLRVLARQLNGVVYGLQCSRDVDFDDIEDHASCFVKEIKKKQPKGPYFLCGYSFGGMLALEMGLQLGKNGEKVTIISIDSSPVYAKITLEQIFDGGKVSMDEVKNALLVQFALYFVNRNKVEELLQNCEEWKKQLEIVGDLVSKQTGLERKDVVLSADRYYKRCKAGYYYQPRSILKGKLVLIRRENNPYVLSEDYDLQKFCQQKVEVLKLKGDHRTILLGESLKHMTRRINEFL